MSVRVAAAVAAAAMAMAPSIASAQAPPPQPPASGWRDGFVLQTESGDYRLQLGGLLHLDGRFGLDDPDGTLVDTWLIRRARPILQARVARYFDFYLVPDFAGGAVNLRNAYVETRVSPAFRVRFGKDKVPFGLERLQTVSGILFVERALPTSAVPDRDVGVQVLGDLAGGTVSYAAGIFNGTVDGASADTDTNDGKDLAGRIVVRPFARTATHPLAGLGVAVAGTTGEQGPALPSPRTSGQQAFFTYSRTAAGTGDRNRVSPQAFYYYKAFGGFWEYVRSSGGVTTGSATGDVRHTAWQVAGSIVLTGERATDRGVRPAAPFDPANRKWGALQVAARYHAFDIDDSVVALGAAGSGARRARAFAAGANWYLNPFVKWVLNFERTTFDLPVAGDRPAEVVLLLRNQLTF